MFSCSRNQALWLGVVLAAVLSATAPGCVPPRKSVDQLAALDPEHATVLREWLRHRPELRLMGRADLSTKLVEGLARLKAPNEPYYLVGDLNADGAKDFAVVMLDMRDKTGRRTVLAIFNGPFGNGRRVDPAFLNESPEFDRDCVLLSAATNRPDWTPRSFMALPSLSNLEDGLGSQVWIMPHELTYEIAYQQD
jgi:hypothetical protein